VVGSQFRREDKQCGTLGIYVQYFVDPTDKKSRSDLPNMNFGIDLVRIHIGKRRFL
jgi:hypothetical protein